MFVSGGNTRSEPTFYCKGTRFIKNSAEMAEYLNTRFTTVAQETKSSLCLMTNNLNFSKPCDFIMIMTRKQ